MPKFLSFRLLQTPILALLFLWTAVLPWAAVANVANAQDFDLDVSSRAFSAGTPPVFSRSASSYVAQDISGHWQVVKNSFQFDETVRTLPDSFNTAKILAVSYYGAVFAGKTSEAGCSLLVHSSQDLLASPLVVSEDPSCKFERGFSNVTDLFLFSVRIGGNTKLLLWRSGILEEVWDAGSVSGGSPVLEGFSINDLNTIAFTISSLEKGRKVYRSFFLVPGKGAFPLVLPRTIGSRPVIRDINNKNKYLFSVAGGVSVFDPVKRRVVSSKAKAYRLTSNGSTYSVSKLYSTDGSNTLASCFARGDFSGHKMELVAVNDERELVLVGSTPTMTRIGKVIPFSIKGYPGCSFGARDRRR